MLDKKEKRIFLKLQKDEATANIIYRKLSEKEKNEQNKGILKKIAGEEKKHYEILKEYTKTDVHPNRCIVFLHSLVLILFGITFLVKLLERGEDKAQKNYRQYYEKYPSIKPIIEDEENHEAELISMINEERLNYIGSIVLGLNDALVELTGALAGFTFAIQTGKLIALTGLITGISAALSMGASEYLSSKTEGDINAKRSAVYTGFTYLITVFLLIIPFFLLQNQFISLAITLSVAIMIIALFNYYISITNDEKFIKKFLEMAVISLGVALISFGIGYLIDKLILS